MSDRLARPFAIGGLILTAVAGIGAIALRVVDPVPVVPNNLGFADLALVSFESLGIAFALVGSLLVVRRPGNAVGWCMVAIGAAYALSGSATALTYSAAAHGTAGAATAGVAGWFAVLFTTIGFLIFGLGFIFPTGRGQTPTWDRVIVALAVAVGFVSVIALLLRPGPLQLFPTIDNPFGVGPDLRSIFGPAVSSLVVASLFAVLPLLAVSIVSRYRRSDAVGRQQLKWFILAFAVAMGAMATASIGAVVGDRPPETGLAVFGFVGALIPVAIGIAILRYRLFEIDRVISRTIGYAAITGVLAAVFGGTILLAGALLTSFTKGLIPSGQGETIAVAISTLVVLALFQPVRRRVQRIVDRRFDRTRYDAGRTIQSFTMRLRNDVELESVRTEILSTTMAAVRPTSAGVWLRRSEHVTR